MLKILAAAFSDAPSWWWKDINNNDPTCLLVTSSLLVFTLSWFTWTLFIKKSKNTHPPLPPGPRGLPLVGNLLSLDPELHSYFTTLARTYGPILTLWLGKKLTIVVTSPTIAREILKEHDVVFANRDVPAAGLQSSYGGQDLAFSQYGAEWRMLRKVAVHEMLSNASLDSVYSLRLGEIQRTIGYLHSQAGKQVKIGEQTFLTILNVVTNMMWGGAITGGDRASVAAEFRRVVAEMTLLLGKLNVSDFYPGLARFDLQGIEKKMKVLVKRLDVIFDGMIEERLKNINGEGGTSTGDDVKQTKDFLQILLQKKEECDAKTPLTMIHVKALLMVPNKEHDVECLDCVHTLLCSHWHEVIASS